MKQRISTLFWSSRPISWVNTGYPFAAGYLLTSRHIDTPLIIGTLFFLIPYNVLMYGINDVFDYESDLLNPRKGGIEGIKLKKEWHGFVLVASSLLCLPFVAYLFTLGGLNAKLFLGYLLFMVVAYSAPLLRFKEKPFLDSFTSSTHFCSPLIFALLVTGWQSSYWPICVSFFLWGMASHAFGAVQDVVPDRAGGIKSVATIIGGANTVKLSILLYCTSACMLLGLASPYWLASGIPLLYVASIVPYASLAEDKTPAAHAGWVRFIKLNWLAGFLVTMLLIIAYRR